MYPTMEQADSAVGRLDGYIMDRQHTMMVERSDGSARFVRAEAAGEVRRGDVDGLQALQLA